MLSKKKSNLSSFLQNLLIRPYVFLFIIISFFIYGVGVGYYKWPPFKQIRLIKSLISEQSTTQIQYEGEFELLQYAFTEEGNIGYYYYPAIENLDQIREANERIFTPIYDFENAFNNLIVLNVQQDSIPLPAESILIIQFSYQGKEYKSYAYGKMPDNCGQASSAALIIPGTGSNESISIALNDPKSYHFGIIDAINHSTNADIFVLIKPNDDIRTWHDGKGHRIDGSFIYNWHLNRGGSYSLSYLLESLALTKWINSCYKTTILAGLSQGGAATLINAKQSNPDIAIVSSGVSILNSKAEWSGAGTQLHAVLELSKLSDKEYLVKTLESSMTKWFFSWGKNEIGTYKIEAEDSLTANAIKHLSNVTVSIHNEGHVFPYYDIVDFLSRAHE